MKTVFSDGDPGTGTLGTIVTAAFLNALNNHRHTGRDVDGEGALNYAVATGSANAYAIDLTPTLDEYIEGMPIVFQANHDNTGAATLDVDELGAVALKLPDGSDLPAYFIKSGALIVVHYDGTYFQVIGGGNYQLATPFGAEMLWPTETPPDGWLEEDGSSLARAAYPELFAVIGTLYGTADGDHFNLPDARGNFPRIWDHGASIDPDAASRTAPTTTGATISAGDHVGTEQADELETHTHVHDYITTGAAYKEIGTGSTYGGHTKNTASTGGNETRPINTARMMIIRAY